MTVERFPATLELAVASHAATGLSEVAERCGGNLYQDLREGAAGLPFRALLTTSSDAWEPLLAAADAGAWVVQRRCIKAGVADAPTGLFGLFPLVHRSDLTRAQADGHWRDVHGPLALQHHAAMTHYSQLAVLHCLQGLPCQGFALCGFADLDSLRDHFFTAPGSRELITADVAKFADTRRSPRRLLATPSTFPAGAG